MHILTRFSVMMEDFWQCPQCLFEGDLTAFTVGMFEAISDIGVRRVVVSCYSPNQSLHSRICNACNRYSSLPRTPSMEIESRLIHIYSVSMQKGGFLNAVSCIFLFQLLLLCIGAAIFTHIKYHLNLRTADIVNSPQ